MLEITTHRFLFLKRKEFWFYNSERVTKGTYNAFCYSNEKDACRKKTVLKEQTSLINLEKSSEELYSKINRTFKYHIHKAESIGITTHVDYSPTPQICNQIMSEFSVFANKKQIEWNPNRIKALRKLNKIIISEAFLKEERIVTHVYLHDANRVVLLHSYNPKDIADKKMQGYANKYLHWKEILSFKNFGLKLYDFGGINMRQHPGISKFKISFGGEVRDCYSYIEVNPLLTLVVNFYKKLKSR
jgi:lipid II:glycine glycyltransferase (peptidoglycan interpeptide bridge formation enzyme)